MKVVQTFEFMNTEALLLGKRQGLNSCEPLLTIFLSADQYITLFYICLGLKRPYLKYIVDSLTLNSFMADSTVTHVLMRLI